MAERVARGGSWCDRPLRARSAFRTKYVGWQRVYNVGFRVIVGNVAVGSRSRPARTSAPRARTAPRPRTAPPAGRASSAKDERAAERYFKMARQAEKMRQRSAAITFYSKIVKDYPGTSFAKRAKERLGKLRK